jgi:hypothetical protein
MSAACAPPPLDQPLDLVAFADWDGVELPADLREIAAREINETEATRESGVCELLMRVAALPASERPDGEEMSTRSLLCFLRARKFRVDQAFEMLCNFTAFKRDNSELFVNLHGEEFRELYAQGWQRVMRGAAQFYSKTKLFFAFIFGYSSVCMIVFAIFAVFCTHATRLQAATRAVASS